MRRAGTKLLTRRSALAARSSRSAVDPGQAPRYRRGGRAIRARPAARAGASSTRSAPARQDQIVSARSTGRFDSASRIGGPFGPQLGETTPATAPRPWLRRTGQARTARRPGSSSRWGRHARRVWDALPYDFNPCKKGDRATASVGRPTGAERAERAHRHRENRRRRCGTSADARSLELLSRPRTRKNRPQRPPIAFSYISSA